MEYNEQVIYNVRVYGITILLIPRKHQEPKVDGIECEEGMSMNSIGDKSAIASNCREFKE